jgi:hypothetical protein
VWGENSAQVEWVGGLWVLQGGAGTDINTFSISQQLVWIKPAYCAVYN